MARLPEGFQSLMTKADATECPEDRAAKPMFVPQNPMGRHRWNDILRLVIAHARGMSFRRQGRDWEYLVHG